MKRGPEGTGISKKNPFRAKKEGHLSRHSAGSTRKIIGNSPAAGSTGGPGQFALVDRARIGPCQFTFTSKNRKTSPFEHKNKKLDVQTPDSTLKTTRNRFKIEKNSPTTPRFDNLKQVK